MVLDDALHGTDTLASLDAAWDAAWTVVDAELLRLCRDRIAMLLRHPPTLDAMPPGRRDALRRSIATSGFDDREQAALAFTEQYIVDVSSITDAQAAALHDHLGDVGLVDFVNALLVIEQRMTLELFAEAVL